MRSFVTRTGLLSLAALLVGVVPALAQTGKVAGQVTEAETGEPLPGVNISIDGTTQGASADVDGYYTILNIPPGEYTLRASFVGYAQQVVENVRVNIDQTTTIDFEMRESVLEGEEIVVTAERPVVQPDVSASLANINSAEIEALPASSISGVVGLQAGVQGLSVRGGGSDELAFNLNGLTLRDERDNTPYTNISLASVDEVQVLTGGFNAEYGNVRSGVINVVTKEGSANRYNVDAILRYSPPAQKHFGPLANDPNAYWIRPFIDPDVAWTGTTSGAWDEAMQRQYPEFDGWIAKSEELLRDNDPGNDMTPAALQQAFLWQHRKEMEIVEPDYNLDVGLGGPIPALNSFLGNARFYASYRRDQNMYLIPLATDRFSAQTGHVKLTSDVGPGMKLSLEGLLGKTTGTSNDRGGQPGIFSSPASIAAQLNRVSFIDTRIFSTDYWGPTEVRTNMVGAKFTHALSSNAFYEARLTRFATAYDTNPGRLRDETPVVFFGGVGFDEGPFGFQPAPSFGVDGMRMGVGMSNARDTSRVTVWNLKADLTNQLNRYLQVKTGAEYNLSESRINYGTFDAFLPGSNARSQWDKTPVRGAAYAQGKLEFQGMIANLGLRLDYAHAGDEWYVFDPFSPAFSARLSAGIDSLLTTEPTRRIVTLSPRLGVSFPVTEFSKLFFNYGHFRSMPDPNNLYLLRMFSETGQVARVADPNNPLPKTVAYEMGYEQALFNQFLVRVAGYYKDISQLPRLVNYISRDGQVDYSLSEPNAFEDVRGFELTVSRNRGRWVQGFVNYTYMVYTSGYFDFRQISENPTAQREFENSDTERRNASNRPVPQPYGRANIDFVTPVDWGPNFGGFSLLGDWRLSFIGRWSSGAHFTWTGGGAIPGVLNNVQVRDDWSLDLRFAKNVEIAGNRVQFFADVFNAWNRKQLSFNNFQQAFMGSVDGNDFTAYMRSLHLPEDPDVSGQSWPNIPGTDRPGDYREDDVAFVPMEKIQTRDVFNNVAASPVQNTIYYEAATESFIEFVDGAWRAVDQGRLDQILEDKAYIDMPNQQFLNFLDPRDVFFGVRISF